MSNTDDRTKHNKLRLNFACQYCWDPFVSETSKDISSKSRSMSINVAFHALSYENFLFLVACTRLYKSLCRLVGRCLRRSVRHTPLILAFRNIFHNFSRVFTSFHKFSQVFTSFHKFSHFNIFSNERTRLIVMALLINNSTLIVIL